ncbi:RNA-binding protein [Alkalispirochaeta americana]|uniref:RNA-binding protein n=1 Tax=Alkalispirochaeta americana TaxID=159291 RepID=A0A1N6UHM9_9SPIO|nr:YhbY family RNA-binding protein [Alkalispirochaeta americana]SIQ65119.1 RNA-binding protein [Alkalispirochaeta americana]
MEDSRELAGYQRAFLLRQAHRLNAVATVGKQGPSESVHRHVDQELDNHELIKVRFSDHKDDRREIAQALARELQATLVAVVGHVAILYRPSRDPEQRKLHLPERPRGGPL